jgi:hypothetical protein
MWLRVQPVELESGVDAGVARRTAVRRSSFVMSGKANMVRTVALVLLIATAGSTAALAQQFPFLIPLPGMEQGTPEERAACQGDVHKYCERALPDVMQIANCLQTNRTRISRACQQVLVNRGL